MQYLSNPDLPHHPATPQSWKGNPFSDGAFTYEREPYRPELRVLLKMIFSANPQRKEKKADNWTPPVKPDQGYLDDRTKDWIVWLGHACFLLQINGLRYLTDPQLTDMPFVPRRVFPPFGYEDIRGVDYLLLSHDHRDHVDKKCLTAICANNAIRKIFCPLKLADLIGGWVGDTPIEEAGWYQVFDTAGTGIRLTFLPTKHWCRRGLTDFNHALWGSFMIEQLANTGGGAQDAKEVGEAKQTIYFGGDSAKTSYWADISTMFPTIDVALLGVGAYKPAFMMEPVHTSPPQAFGGFQDLGAHYWWPMHHGTYNLSHEPASEPIRWSAELMAEAGLEDRLLQPAINEPWYF